MKIGAEAISFIQRSELIWLIFWVTLIGFSACSHSAHKNFQAGNSQVGPPLLYVVNGKKLSADSARAIIPRIKQKYIEQIRVLTGNKAKILFGKAAKNGVIQYKLSNKKKAFADLLPKTRDSLSAADSIRQQTEKVYNAAQQQPVLKGGLRKLERKVKYPPKCKKAGKEGMVVVQVIVNKQGKSVNPKIIKGIGHGCDKEAIRVAETARFSPGKINGKPVAVKYLLPIVFEKSADSKPANTN
jgi:TonB family protein